MASQDMIKITCFKQLNLVKKEQPIKPSRDSYLLNIVVYSPNKLLKFLDGHLRQINEASQLNIIKCNNISTLAYSLDSCKIGVKTILIIDKEIDEENVKKILQNQNLLKNKDYFTCWIFTKSVEAVNPSWFHTPAIEVITIDQNKLISLLKQQYEKNRKQLNSYNSATTILSNDQINMEIKLGIQQSPKKNILTKQKENQDHLQTDNIAEI